MKNIYITLLLFLGMLNMQMAYSQDKEKTFQQTIRGVIHALNTKDNVKLNSHIHPQYSLTVLYKQGVATVFAKISKFDFSRPLPHHVPFTGVDCEKTKVRNEGFPSLDCTTGKWSKSEGVYSDALVGDHRLSELYRFHIDFMQGDYTEDDYRSAVSLENQSRKIIVRDKANGALVFYLSYIDNKWYFTILDRAAESCDK